LPYALAENRQIGFFCCVSAFALDNWYVGEPYGAAALALILSLIKRRYLRERPID
jgi:hypothetical protein